MNNVNRQLAEFLAGYRPGAFDWTSANCAHFAAGWVRHVTGRDALVGLPITTSAMDARRLVRALGGMRTAVSTCTGWQQIAAPFAQVGDLVLRELPDGGNALGICAGRTCMHVDEHGNVVHIEMAGATCAWRVPAC